MSTCKITYDAIDVKLANAMLHADAMAEQTCQLTTKNGIRVRAPYAVIMDDNYEMVMMDASNPLVQPSPVSPVSFHERATSHLIRPLGPD